MRPPVCAPARRLVTLGVLQGPDVEFGRTRASGAAAIDGDAAIIAGERSPPRRPRKLPHCAIGERSTIGYGVLMIGAADVGYVLKCGDTQYRTIADRKFWGAEQEQDAIRAERQRWREDVGVRKPALEVNVHRAFSNFIRKLMWLQPGGSRCVRSPIHYRRRTELFHAYLAPR